MLHIVSPARTLLSISAAALLTLTSLSGAVTQTVSTPPLQVYEPVGTPLVAQSTPVEQPDEQSNVNDTAEQAYPRSQPTTASLPSSTQSVVRRNPESAQDASPSTPSLIHEYVLGDTIVYGPNSSTFPNRTYTASVIPNDPSSGQWWEHSLGLQDSWDISAGSQDSLLAIIDTGFALDHEEFAGRWHTNTGEEGVTATEGPSVLNCTDQSIALDQSCNIVDDNFDGIVDNESGATTTENLSQLNCTDQSMTLNKSCNMIDDDGNGFVDDYSGWDFVNYDRSPQAGETNPSGSGTRHASYVTGVAAANAQNNVGLAGVNWHTKVLPLQALSDEGTGNSVSVARSIRYAVSQGVDVISLSLGGPLADGFLRQTITEAIAAGVIVVAASGNDGCECISYPANYEEVVAVGALSSSGVPASFSSWGDNLDILAPGVGLYTASWTAANPTNSYASFISGTSLATPLVSAALTTLKSQRPDASIHELLALLTENTDRLTLPASTPRSNTLGYGTADLHTASLRASTPAAHDHIISFANTSHGNTLYSNFDLEQSNQSPRLYECLDGSFGSTTIYRLHKSPDLIYTTSLSEVGRAKENGYTSTLLGHFCTVMPHDTITSVRDINTYAEFGNVYVK